MTKTSASVKYPHGKNPNSLRNLQPYKPGENGNPKPGNSLKASLLNALGQPLIEPKPDAPVRDHIVYATLKGAIDADPSSTHLKEVWDRTEGKIQDVSLTNFNDNRVINFILLPGESKELIEGIAKRLNNTAGEGEPGI